jgi:hypothetical protein
MNHEQILSRLKNIVKKPEFLVTILLLISLLFIYRNVFLKNYIAFPSNFLAAFYSPWSTQKFEGYPNGVPHKPIGGNDNVRMFYPYRTFTNESLKRGELPLWNPYNFAGSPILANFQSATFYPLNLLYLALPQIDAWTILTIIQTPLAALFMYLYLKLILQNKQASLLGAISFGFSGFMVAWSQENAVVGHSLLWLPMILYATEKNFIKSTWKTFILLVFTIFSCIVAGHHQFSFQVLLLTFAYSIYRSLENKKINKKFLATIIGGYLLAATISLVQLIPTFQAFSQSPRSSTSSASVVEGYLVPVTHFILALTPDVFGNPGSYNYVGRGFYQEQVFYAGIIPLLFAVFAVKSWKQSSLIKFFTAATIITYLATIRWPVANWIFSLPLISTFTPSRLLTITSTAVSVLAAFGFKEYLENRSEQNRKLLLRIFKTVFLIIAAFLALLFGLQKNIFPNNQSIIDYVIRPDLAYDQKFLLVSIKNSVLPILMLIGTAVLIYLRNLIPKSTYLIVSMVIIGQFYFLNKYLVLGDRKFLYPEHFVLSDVQTNQGVADRFLTFGSPILGNVALDKHVYSPDGIDPIFPSRYGQLIYAAKNDGKFSTNIPRIESNLSEYSENNNIRDNNMRQRLISLLGVTRVYNYQKNYSSKNFDSIFPLSQYQPLWNKDDWQAYQNKLALPRAFLASEYIVETDNQKIIDGIFNPNIDLRKTIFLEEKPENFDSSVSSSSSSAAISDYKPQLVEIKTSSSVPQLLFLSDNMYPGWKAFIDGTPTKIYRANFTFRAVVVPVGEHTVVYRFQP